MTAPSTASGRSLDTSRSAIALLVAAHRAARLARRGFTLVELMVALSAGLAVAAGAYMLSQTSLETFTSEARINAAQYSGMMGMNRLTADLRRAGFMASPNLAKDPRRCGVAPAAPVPELITAFRLYEGAATGTYGAGPSTASPAYGPLPAVVTGAENNRAPDRFRIAGNFATNEVFEFTDIDVANKVVHLAVDRNAMQRVYRDSKRGAPGICTMFPRNSWVRLVDAAGMETYVRLVNDSAHCAAVERTDSTGWDKSVKLKFNSTLPTVPSCNPAAGPGYANPVDLVEYVVKYLKPISADLVAEGFPGAVAPFVDPDPSTPDLPQADIDIANAVTGEGTRLQLVRRRLAGDGTILANSAEIVADHVADLNFRLNYKPAAAANTLALADFDQSTATGAPGAANDWQEVRTVGVRLGIRAKGPEREADGSVVPTSNLPLRRFRLFPASATNRLGFARVRNLYTEVHLTNLMGVTW
jgi:prepilin-type N-terminal cleavage/methylation domain-containing protein